MPAQLEKSSGVDIKHYQKLEELCDRSHLDLPSDKEMMQQILRAWIPEYCSWEKYRILVSVKEELLLQYIKDLLVGADVLDEQWDISIKTFGNPIFHELKDNMAISSVCCGVYISSPGGTFKVETICDLYNNSDSVWFRDWKLAEK